MELIKKFLYSATYSITIASSKSAAISMASFAFVFLRCLIQSNNVANTTHKNSAVIRIRVTL